MNIKSKYIELCYLSPDWRVYKDRSLQELVEDDAMALLDVERKSLKWKIDKDTKHRHLFVVRKDIPEHHDNEDIKYAQAYMMGFAFAIGYM